MSTNKDAETAAESNEQPAEKVSPEENEIADNMYGEPADDSDKKEPAEKEPAEKEPAEKEPAEKEPAEKEPAEKESDGKEKVEYKLEGVDNAEGAEGAGFISALAPTLNEAGVSNEQFNALAKKMVEYNKASSEKMAEETRNDPEFVGKGYEEKMGIANLAFMEYGSEKLTSILENAGLMNNTELVRAFYNIGKKMKEDDGVGGNSDANKKNSFQDTLDDLYKDSVK